MGSTFTFDSMSAIMDENTLSEDMAMVKFYNFNCINLITIMNLDAALALVNQGVLNTPIELFEGPNVAKSVVPLATDKVAVCMAVDVTANIFDEFNLVERDAKKLAEMRCKAWVIRSLKKRIIDGKNYPYISYIINNRSAIRNVYPIHQQP